MRIEKLSRATVVSTLKNDITSDVITLPIMID